MSQKVHIIRPQLAEEEKQNRERELDKALIAFFRALKEQESRREQHAAID